MKDSFSKLHPSILLVYFAMQAILTAVCFHPMLIGISLICAMLYTALCVGVKQAFKWMVIGVVYVLSFGIVNPLLNHQGNTVLFLLLGKAVTLQSVCYGMLTGAMMWSICLWLYLMGKIVESKKVMYIFGKVTPTLALMMFMSLRLLKRYRIKAEEIFEAQSAAFRARSKLRIGKDAIGALLTYALENGIDTADSMKARGYGVGKVSGCYDYDFTPKDYVAAAVLLPALAVVLWGISLGACKMYFFPEFFVEKQNRAVPFAYGIISIYPLAVYMWSEVRFCFAVFSLRSEAKWKSLK